MGRFPQAVDEPLAFLLMAVHQLIGRPHAHLLAVAVKTVEQKRDGQQLIGRFGQAGRMGRIPRSRLTASAGGQVDYRSVLAGSKVHHFRFP